MPNLILPIALLSEEARKTRHLIASFDAHPGACLPEAQTQRREDLADLEAAVRKLREGSTCIDEEQGREYDLLYARADLDLPLEPGY